MCEWLTEKLDSFSSKLKPEAKELLEVGSGLWAGGWAHGWVGALGEWVGGWVSE